MRLKNQTPKLKGNELFREELINYIDNIVNEYRVVLINAPAGYGKTTSIISWLKEKNIINVNWISLDIFDNKLKDFLLNFVDSNVFLDKALFYNNEKDISEHKCESYILELLEEISKINETIYFIIDDLQVITSLEVYNAFNYFLHNIPSNLKLILLSRNKLKDISFSELKRRNDFFEIGYEKLTFKNNDLMNYVSLDDIKNNNLDLIIKKTEGWIFSIQILDILLKNRIDKIEAIKSFSGNNKDIKDFLLSEVIDNLSEEIQDFLLKTSFLNTFNYNLCNYILDINNSQEIINYLINNNLFIISLDDNNDWFRYHDLFSEFLFSMFKIKNSNNIDEFYIRVSDWYKLKEDLDESIRYASLIRDYSYIVNIIENNFKKMFSEKKIFKLLEYFNYIPLNHLITYPLPYLYYLKCISFYSDINNIFELEKLINEFELSYKTNNLNNYILSTFYYIKAICGVIRREPEIIKINIDKIFIFIEEDNYEYLGNTNLLLGFYYELIYDLNNSINYYHIASQYFYKLNDYNSYMECFYYISNLLFTSGKLRDAKTKLLKIINHEKLNIKNIFLYQNLYEIYYHLNEINLFNKIVYDIIDLKESINFYQLYVILSNLAEYSLYLCLFDEASIYINEINVLLNKYSNFYIEKDVIYLLNTIKNIKLRDYENSNKFIEKYLYIKYMDSFKGIRFIYIILLIEALILLNRLSDAEIIINKSLIEYKDYVIYQIKIYLLKSFLYYKQNKLNEAKSSIFKALQLGEEEGFIRLFTDSPKEIHHLILEVINSKINLFKRYINNIKKSFNSEVRDLLSNREIEILKFISNGLSNQQISDKLHISLNTVKAHIKNIFKKLNIERRTQVIQKQKELNL